MLGNLVLEREAWAFLGTEVVPPHMGLICPPGMVAWSERLMRSCHIHGPWLPPCAVPMVSELLLLCSAQGPCFQCSPLRGTWCPCTDFSNRLWKSYSSCHLKKCYMPTRKVFHTTFFPLPWRWGLKALFTRFSLQHASRSTFWFGGFAPFLMYCGI